MSEVEALRKQLREMQEENDGLRALLNRKKHQDAYPDSILGEFRQVLAAVGRKPVMMSAHKYFLKDSFSQKLSTVIRSTVFADTAHDGKKNTVYISTQDMNEEDYALWLDVLGQMLSVLEDGMSRRQEILERRERYDEGGAGEHTA